jgi:spermidine synthase
VLELPVPAALNGGRLRLLEPAGSRTAPLLRRLIEGSYGKPFILDRGSLRSLQFDLTNIQSVMRRNEPDALHLAYTRKMMAFLLFNPDPRRILLLGLGGGSLAKFCYRRLPDTRITVVEIDSAVIALRGEFLIPADDERFQVLHEDAVTHIARKTPREDVILVDACDRNGVAPALAAPGLYLDLARRLTPDGVLVMNICGDPDVVAGHFARILGVFGEQVIALPVAADGNLIVLAFRQSSRIRCDAQLLEKAVALKKRFGLPFSAWARAIRMLA